MCEDLSVAVSIRCQRCLTWSADDADFCHRCGMRLRPLSDQELFLNTAQLLKESGEIIQRLKNLRFGHLEARCAHCGRWRDHRRMKRTASGWLCFDNVECCDNVVCGE